MDLKHLEGVALTATWLGMVAHPKSIAMIIALNTLYHEKGEDATIKDVRELEKSVDADFKEAVKLREAETTQESDAKSVADKVEEQLAL